MFAYVEVGTDDEFILDRSISKIFRVWASPDQRFHYGVRQIARTDNSTSAER
jgi:hypothetical protein